MLVVPVYLLGAGYVLTFTASLSTRHSIFFPPVSCFSLISRAFLTQIQRETDEPLALPFLHSAFPS